MTASELLMFFDKSQPCPSGLLNCEELRQQYEADVQNLIKNNGCSGCVRLALRDKYIDIILGKK